MRPDTRPLIRGLNLPREGRFQPLTGLRAIELGHFVAGPSLGSLLTMYGAEVIKVEPPQGDISLKTAPWAYYLYNMGKKDICIDLLKPDGFQVFERLVATSDILVENLSPESVVKLGVVYDRLSRINPKLVYCSIKGFASDSPHHTRPAFDAVAQAEGGMMATTGVEGGGFMRVNNPSVDMGAAAYGFSAIILALLERSRTGRGCYIEVPLLEVAIYWNGYWIAYHALMGREPERLGAGHAGYSPYGVYRTREGHIFIGIITDEQWRKLCSLLGIPPSPELESMQQRIGRRHQVDRLVEEATQRYTTEELLSKLGETIPVARVRRIGEIASDGNLIELGVIRERRIDGAQIKVVTPPIIMDGSRALVPERPSTTGLHTTEILKSLGYGENEIIRLKETGAVR
jgi:crotonobetainyl-CoA:carnitine CoA-transferase CaiB-like acyl-CoA transferase